MEADVTEQITGLEDNITTKMNITTTQKIENLDTKQTEQDKDANADDNISIEEESPRDLCNDNNRGCQFSLTRFFVQLNQFFLNKI